MKNGISMVKIGFVHLTQSDIRPRHPFQSIRPPRVVGEEIKIAAFKNIFLLKPEARRAVAPNRQAGTYLGCDQRELAGSILIPQVFHKTDVLVEDVGHNKFETARIRRRDADDYVPGRT